jgi:DNA-binding IclR family transcriptional regulator
MATGQSDLLTGSAATAGGRSLSTARAVLRVLAFLAQNPGGVRAHEVAEVTGKSVSTAYYLLTSLCEEGFAVHEAKGIYRAAQALGTADAPSEPPAPGPGDRSSAVEDLFLKTHKRAYLGKVKPGRIEIVAVRGQQGIPNVPGLGSEIRDSAHALAMGKVVLALLRDDALERYIGRGLRAFTRSTITRPKVLVAELEEVRSNGFAIDREEFSEDFCCVAAPVRDEGGRFVAALGLSTSLRSLDADRDELAGAVLEVARTRRGAPRDENGRPLQVDAEKHKLLGLPGGRG